MGSVASRIIKNTGWLYAKMGITMFISLYTTRLILHGLGASDFGIYNIVGASISMLGFLNAAMSIATQRFMSFAEGADMQDKKIVIFNVSLFIHIIIALVIGCVLCICGSIWFDSIFNIPLERLFAAKVIYGCLIVSTILSILTVPYEAVLNAHENMKYYAKVGIIESLLRLAVAFFCVWTSQDKLVIYGILMSIIPFSMLVIMRNYCKNHYEECHLSIIKHYDSRVAKDMVGFAGWTFLTTASSMTTQYGMGLVINHFFGVIVNAAHGIAMQLTGMLMAFTTSAQKALNPIMTKSEGAKERDRLIYLSLFGCRMSYFIFGLFAIPAVLLMPEILSIWLVNVPIWSILFCRLSLLRILSEQLIISLVTAINAEGNIRLYSILRSVAYILPIPVLVLIFKAGYPPYWLYIIWIIAWSLVGGYITIMYSKHYIGISYAKYFKFVITPCVLSTIISLVPYFFRLFEFGNSVSSYLLVFLQIVLYITGGIQLLLNKEERHKLIFMIEEKGMSIIFKFR